jgi:hypothetical protein
MLEKICMPALIYLIFSMTHVIIDTYKGLYNTAIIEFWISAVFTILLNLLCIHDMSIISWLIISIPFLLMTVIAALLLFSFRLNPATGQSLQSTTSPTTTSPTTTSPTPTTSPTTNSPAPSMHAYPIDVLYSSSLRSSK